MRSSFDRFLALWLSRRGYTVFHGDLVDRLLADHLRNIFRNERIDVVLDVGANIGQYRDFLREQVGFGGLIHSFEPNTRLLGDLQARTATDPNWHVHPYAIGDQPAERTFHIMKRPTFSSFRVPSRGDTERFSDVNQIVETALTRIVRLADIADELAGVRDGRVYLKTDTQGFDLEVLRGAAGILASTRAMQFEIAFKHLYEGAPKYQELLAEAQRFSFEISAFVPVSMDENLSAIEMDCVLVKVRGR